MYEPRRIEYHFRKTVWERLRIELVRRWIVVGIMLGGGNSLRLAKQIPPTATSPSNFMQTG